VSATAGIARNRAEIRAGRGDVVLVLGFTSWAAAARRGRVHPQDRLAAALVRSGRVERLLLCNPYRSLPLKLARKLIGPREEPFPSSERRRLHEPLRLRRSDPTRVAAARRSAAALERGARRAARGMGLRRPAVITDHPLVAGFGGGEWAGSVTYYATDDLTADPPLRPAWVPVFEAAFAQIRTCSRRVVAVTPAALEAVGPDGPAAVVPNGIDPSEWLDPGGAPAWFAALPRPRMIYVGTLDERIDPAAVRALAAAHPGGSVSLVGRRTGAASIEALASIPNVRIRPPVPRGDLPGLVAAAELGLVPHVRNPQTEAMSPLKLYEYLAAGLPVAAADLPGIAGVCPERTRLARGGGEIVEAAGSALELGGWAEPARRRFLAENAWDRRFEDLLDVALAPDAGGPPAAREGT
jgi:glycosyltransferase involved in cell wall biosynthesis